MGESQIFIGTNLVNPASFRLGSGGLLLASGASAADDGAEGRSGSKVAPTRAVASGLIVPLSTVKQVVSGFTIPEFGVGLHIKM